jgi:hypothetical protein
MEINTWYAKKYSTWIFCSGMESGTSPCADRQSAYGNNKFVFFVNQVSTNTDYAYAHKNGIIRAGLAGIKRIPHDWCIKNAEWALAHLILNFRNSCP